MRIAALTASDAPQYRELMLEAYVQALMPSPPRLRSARRSQCPVGQSASPQLLASASPTGAFQAEQLVGTVALEYSPNPRPRHSALVVGMYVKPAARRFSHLCSGAMLMQSAIVAARAKPEPSHPAAHGHQGNEAAIRLYESVGFSAWGVEPMAILTPSGYKGKPTWPRSLAVLPAAQPFRSGSFPQNLARVAVVLIIGLRAAPSRRQPSAQNVRPHKQSFGAIFRLMPVRSAGLCLCLVSSFLAVPYNLARW